ncbi:MAG: hypothetical protein IKR19_07490 [Acholeplasmatales bacterium]|nr:hypothetical protein [Acholeplasmatales bacterium]
MEYAPINVHVEKASVEGKVYDVLDYNEYAEHFENNKERSDIAIKEEYNGQTLVLPYRGKYPAGGPISPGIYRAGSVDFIKRPDREYIHNFIPNKIVSMSNMSDIRDILKEAEEARKLDEPYLTSPDNITTIKIGEDDQPEMRALKMAINAKHIDLDKYAGRFGANFPNDKRQLKGNNITLNIIKRYCENCDMEAILTLKDSRADVPNPIGKEITVSLTDVVPSDDNDAE